MHTSESFVVCFEALSSALCDRCFCTIYYNLCKIVLGVFKYLLALYDVGFKLST